ncbi:hypothetical protein Bca4012_097871 [Brassica carinata]|uniref:Uncharacterized protein n=1 Tax=Brassica carinata TaxID=52824 RepID=A0A8X7PFS4_BRACI|nr:hypothetical protein Bca52824_080586 [Brassica carinata]
MMVEDLRVQAKWAVLPEVAKLLPFPNFCNIFLQSRPIAWHVNRAAKRWSNQITIHVFLFREESQTKRLKRMFQTRFKIPYQFLDTHPFVDSLVQSDYHLSSEVKHQNFFISEMRRLIKETQYTLLLYIQASHASDWTDNKGDKEANLSVENSRRRYIDGEHWFDVEGTQDYGKTEVKDCPDDFGRDEKELEEETEAEKNAGEFADEIGDGLILRVKVMRCMLIKKSSLEKLLMCKKSIMMFSMIDAKRAVKELRTQCSHSSMYIFYVSSHFKN